MVAIAAAGQDRPAREAAEAPAPSAGPAPSATAEAGREPAEEEAARAAISVVGQGLPAPEAAESPVPSAGRARLLDSDGAHDFLAQRPVHVALHQGLGLRGPGRPGRQGQKDKRPRGDGCDLGSSHTPTFIRAPVPQV